MAMTRPHDLMAQDRMRHLYGRDTTFQRYHLTQRQFNELLSRAYDYALGLEEIFQEIDRAGENLTAEDYANPTIRLVHTMLLEAVHNRASDIHLEPESFFTRVRHRIDGTLHPIITFHHRHWKAVCARLKLMACVSGYLRNTPPAKWAVFSDHWGALYGLQGVHTPHALWGKHCNTPSG